MNKSFIVLVLLLFVVSATALFDRSYFVIEDLNVSNNYFDLNLSDLNGTSLSSVYYPTDLSSDLNGYEVLQSFPDFNSNSDSNTVSSGTGTVLIDSYVTAENNPYVTVIPSGTYSFYVYAGISSDSGETFIDINVMKIDVNGVVTNFFGVTTPEINGVTSTLYQVNYTLTEDYDVNLTDRFVVKFYGRNNHATNKTITLYYGEANAYTYIRTTLPAGGSSGYVRYIGNTNNVDLSDFNVTMDCITLSDGNTFCEKPAGGSSDVNGSDININLEYANQIILDKGSSSKTSLRFDNSDTGIYSRTGGSITFVTNGAEWGEILSTGLTTWASGGGTMLHEKATATNPCYAFSGDTDTGLGKNNANEKAKEKNKRNCHTIKTIRSCNYRRGARWYDGRNSCIGMRCRCGSFRKKSYSGSKIIINGQGKVQHNQCRKRCYGIFRQFRKKRQISHKHALSFWNKRNY